MARLLGSTRPAPIRIGSEKLARVAIATLAILSHRHAVSMKEAITATLAVPIAAFVLPEAGPSSLTLGFTE
ncbi:MAG: hypothetical protein DME23_27395 [Verrucomicrobia bacterium]|nr:MAG: hypothetical protein DME23_27395 [Verrucomicrobiota bacterium]